MNSRCAILADSMPELDGAWNLEKSSLRRRILVFDVYKDFPPRLEKEEARRRMVLERWRLSQLGRTMD